MKARLAILTIAVGAAFLAAPAVASTGIGWGPEDHGVRTIVAGDRVLTRERDQVWDRDGRGPSGDRSRRH